MMSRSLLLFCLSLLLVSASKIISPFSLESEAKRPQLVPLATVSQEFQRLQSQFEGTVLAEPISLSISLWPSLSKHSSARFRNYHTLKADEIAGCPSKEAYYLSFWIVAMAGRDLFAVLDKFYDALVCDNEFSVYLLDQLVFRNPDLVVELLAKLIIENRAKAAERIIEKYPRLVNYRFSNGVPGRSMTLLALALIHNKLRLAQNLVYVLGADVNAHVIDDPEEGPIPTVFLALSDDSDITQDFLDLIVGDPEFNHTRCFDSRGRDPIVFFMEERFSAVSLDSLLSFFDWRQSYTVANLSLRNVFDVAIFYDIKVYTSIISYQNGFDYGEVDNDSNSYLHLAAIVDSPKVAKELIEVGRENGIYQLRPGFYNYWLTTPLVCAVVNKSHKTLKVLVKAATAEEINDYFGWNPLPVAIMYGDVESVRILLEHPDIDITKDIHANLPGVSAVDFALNFGTAFIHGILQNHLSKHPLDK